VATRVGGVPELVEDGKSGILVPARDSEALAKAVRYLLQHPDEATQMGQNARERAVSQFDIKICAKKHEEVFRSVLS